MITEIIYNWRQNGDNSDGFGEDFDVASVGKKDTNTKLEVIKIEEHCASGEGDKWYYDVSFIDGSSVRLFNPNMVYRSKADSNF